MAKSGANPLTAILLVGAATTGINMYDGSSDVAMMDRLSAPINELLESNKEGLSSLLPSQNGSSLSSQRHQNSRMSIQEESDPNRKYRPIDPDCVDRENRRIMLLSATCGGVRNELARK